MSPPTRRSGTPPQRPAPEKISHREATDRDETTAADRQVPASVSEPPDVPLPYGTDHPDTDLWVDRDGRVYCGDGPYLHRPLRRLRRAIRQWWLR